MATETLKRICLRSEKKIEMISKLLSDDEQINKFIMSSDYYREHFYISTPEQTDILSAIEDTLHRMIEAGWSDDDIAFVLDAHKDVFEDTEDAEDTEDTDETITPIDLGYSLIGEVIFHRKGYKLECQ